MRKIFIALTVLALGISINISGIITVATPPDVTVLETALSSGAAIVKEIVGRHLGPIGCDIRLASENDEDDNGDNGKGKEEETERDPLEGGIERIWNSVQLA